jgi:hypothetical protein
LGIGDWGLGIGDWPNPQSPIPNPQSPIPNPHYLFLFFNLINKNKLKNLFKIFNLISNLIIRTYFIITIYIIRK